MLFGEYDYDTDIRVQRREAFEDGVEQKAIETAKNLLSMSLSLEDISKATGLPLNQVEKLAQECKNQK